jgi:membrane protease YdiL (CAAX protease family)
VEQTERSQALLDPCRSSTPSSVGRDSLIVTALAGVAGYFGLFGFGHFFLGRWSRGLFFLCIGIVTLWGAGVLAITERAPEGARSLALMVAMIALLWQVEDAIASTNDRPGRSEFPELAQVPAAALLLVPLPAAIESLYWAGPSPSKLVDDLIYSVANWCVLLLIVGLLQERGGPVKTLRWFRSSATDLLWVLLGIFFVQFPLKLLSSTAIQLLACQVRPLNHSHGPGIMDLALGFICDGLTTAFVEEALYRGFLITYLLARGWSVVVAASLSMIVFAAIHVPDQGLGGALGILIWSLVPTFLFLWRGSLLPGIIVHLYSDSFAFLKL